MTATAMMAQPGLQREAPSREPRGGATVLDRLRHALRAIEGTEVGRSARSTPLGIACIDEALGGGLADGTLHEIAAMREAGMAAATGFALALAARSPGPVVWVAEDMGLIESGRPYGPGLDDLGLAPERLVTVAAAKSRDVLWAIEEALQCRGIGAVIGEIRSADIDLTTTRRLSLAAGRRGGLALLLRSAPGREASAAATRWTVEAAPSDVAAPFPTASAPTASAPTRSGAMALGPGPARFAVSLARNRRGHPGSWVLEWNRVEHCFDLASAHREPVAQAALDRPRQAAGA